jgi:hypothetical protein
MFNLKQKWCQNSNCIFFFFSFIDAELNRVLYYLSIITFFNFDSLVLDFNLLLLWEYSLEMV